MIFKVGTLVFTLLLAQNLMAEQLQLRVEGIHPELGGKLRVQLHQHDAAWLDDEEVRQKLVKDVDGHRVIKLQFEHLDPSLPYAIRLYHDANNNGKLDFSWLPPKPKEGVGISNNHMRMGPPDFKKAVFYLRDIQQPLVIQLKYL